MTKNVQEMPQYPRNTQPNLFALSMVTLTPKYLGNAKTTKLFQETLKKVGLAHKAKKKVPRHKILLPSLLSIRIQNQSYRDYKY